MHKSRIMQRISCIDFAGLFLCIKRHHKSGMIYGYARVSTDGQSVEAQVRQLAKAGCAKVFREVASGAKTDRAQLRKALDRLEAGDVLMVTRLDRLADRRATCSTRWRRSPAGRPAFAPSAMPGPTPRPRMAG